MGEGATMNSMEIYDKKQFSRRWKPFRSLLDDESPLVRKALLDQLKANAEEGVVFLREMSDDEDPLLARHAQDLIKSLVPWVMAHSAAVVIAPSKCGLVQGVHQTTSHPCKSVTMQLQRRSLRR